jgi:hypothetical protein
MLVLIVKFLHSIFVKFILLMLVQLLVFDGNYLADCIQLINTADLSLDGNDFVKAS